MDVLALAVVHDHDERYGLALGDEVVKDLSGVALGRPALLVLGVSVLKIQDRVFLVRILLILRGEIDIAVAHALRGLGPVVFLFDRPLGHILDLPEIHVVGRDLDTAAPTSGSEEIDGSWIGHRCSVDVQLIVVEAHVLGIGRTGPYAVLILRHLIPLAGDIQLDSVGLRGAELRADGALGVYHGILVAELVGDIGFEILDGAGE